MNKTGHDNDRVSYSRYFRIKLNDQRDGDAEWIEENELNATPQRTD